MHLTWTRRLSSDLRGQLLRTTLSVVVLFLLPALALAQSSGIAGTVSGSKRWRVARCDRRSLQRRDDRRKPNDHHQW